MPRFKRIVLCVVLAAGALGAPVGAAQQPQTPRSVAAPADLEGILKMAKEDAKETKALEEIPQIRLEALREAALRYGTRGGLARRSYEIAMMLADQETMLDGIYNFGAMLLDKNVLPPVLSEAQNWLNQPDPNTIRVADAAYRIERQAQFVTVPPNWREYLVRDYKHEIERPTALLLPQNEAETKLWQKYVADGWALGVRQADEIFQRSLARLERDFKGMVLYRSLLAKGMISKPYVAQASMGVTGDGDAININDRILRITAKPQLETDAAKWKPLAVPK